MTAEKRGSWKGVQARGSVLDQKNPEASRTGVPGGGWIQCERQGCPRGVLSRCKWGLLSEETAGRLGQDVRAGLVHDEKLAVDGLEYKRAPSIRMPWSGSGCLTFSFSC